jgi:hypothetical protein
MRLLKIFSASLFLILSIVLLPHSVSALPSSSYNPTNQLINSPIIITNYSTTGVDVNYIQLYNTSDEVINIDNWRLEYLINGQIEFQTLVSLHGLLKPGGYVLAADSGATPDADFSYATIPQSISTVSTIQLVPSSLYLTQTLTVKGETIPTYYKRNVSSSTGDYLTTFSVFTPTSDFTLYIGGLYDLPQDPLLQFSEILAHPRMCSPLELRSDCSDYVKLFNPTDRPIDLSHYRLRNGYQGQISSANNTFSLSGIIGPGHYVVITKSSDDRPISLINSGGFVWLEDLYGLQRYDTSVQEYADAGSDSKVGQAWAYDSSDDTWKWTTQPTLSDSPSVFPVVAAATPTTLVACREGQYRSEETNRCRSIVTAAAATLTPCDEGKERNPATNRCRTIATTSGQLAPCAAGQERNSDTNRCRKVASNSIPPAGFAVKPTTEDSKVFIGWWALGIVTLIGATYGVWEWRHEMINSARTLYIRMKS